MFGNTGLLGHLGNRRCSTEPLSKLPLSLVNRSHGIDHASRDTDQSRLLRQRAADSTADPEPGVRRERVLALPVELLCRRDEADVSLLDQIEQVQAQAGVPT